MNNSFILIPGRPDILERCKNFLEGLPDDKRWEVTIKRAKSQRSIQQNKYFHGPVVGTFCDYTGDTPKRGKAILKELCANVETIEMPDGSIKEVAQATSDMKVDEFSDFLERCIAWMASEGLVLPPKPWEAEE